MVSSRRAGGLWCKNFSWGLACCLGVRQPCMEVPSTEGEANLARVARAEAGAGGHVALLLVADLAGRHISTGHIKDAGGKNIISVGKTTQCVKQLSR